MAAANAVVEVEVTPVSKVRMSDIAPPLPVKFMKSEMVPFTKAVALRYKNMLTFVGDRKLHNENTDKLLRQAVHGLFISTESALISCTCGWDGRVRRVNGQHTSEMRLQMPDGWNPLVQLRHYYAKTEEDFRAFYSIIDDIKAKTSRQIVAANCLGTDQFKGKNTVEINQLSVGIRIWKSVVKDKGANIHDTVRSMRKDMNGLCQIVSRFLVTITGDDAPHMHNRAPIVAALFTTFEKSEKDANVFWAIVRDGGKPPDHPAQMLRNYLTRAKIFTSNTRASRTHKPVSREMMYRACIVAWNAFRDVTDGTPVNLKRQLAERPLAK